MLSFEERKALLANVLSNLSSEELYAELCSVDAVGPTVNQFFGKTPKYNLFPESCQEQTFSKPLTKITVNQLSPKFIHTTLSSCCNDVFLPCEGTALAA